MSHFSTLKTRITNTELLLETLREDFRLNPTIESPTSLRVQGSQFNCRFGLSLHQSQDGVWNLSGDLYYINLSRLGGTEQDVRENLTKQYTRRLLQQQINLNGAGWELIEEKQTLQGTTFVVKGALGETVEASLSKDGKNLQIGVNGVAGTSCLDLTNQLTTTYQVEEQMLKQEFYEEDASFLMQEYQ